MSFLDYVTEEDMYGSRCIANILHFNQQNRQSKIDTTLVRLAYKLLHVGLQWRPSVQ